MYHTYVASFRPITLLSLIELYAYLDVLFVDSSRVERYHDVILDRYRKYGKIYKETIAGETQVHLLDPDYIQTVYKNETKIPYIVPLMETTQMYRRLRKMSPGLGNRSDICIQQNI